MTDAAARSGPRRGAAPAEMGGNPLSTPRTLTIPTSPNEVGYQRCAEWRSLSGWGVNPYHR